MVTVTITHADGSTETIDETLGWERRREIGSMRKVVIMVNREDASAVTLNRQEDKIDLGSIDTVRLVDVEKHGSTWKLVCYSAEWDANKEAPTAGGVKRTGSDDSLINTAIGNVDAWTAGTVNSFTGSLTFIANHALEHEFIRRVERNVPGEILFRDFGTVDYTDRLGSDKSASITLSAAEQNLDGEINITSRGRELDGTHVRVIGAHEGEAQIYANLVPSGDTTAQSNLSNVVTYTTSRWSDSSDTVWDRWQNKDVTDQATIEEEASTLGDELSETLVEAEATVVGENIGVGDTVHVEKRDTAGNLVLDRDMRIHRIKTVRAGSTERDEVRLSTRTVMRQDDGKDLRDIQRFNTAFQGTSVWGTLSGGYQAVSPSVNYELGAFDYPDVAFEHDVSLWVKSIPYKTYSSGAAANNIAGAQAFSRTSTTFDSLSSGSWQTLQTYGGSSSNIASFVWGAFWYPDYTTGNHTVSLRVQNNQTGNYYPESTGTDISVDTLNDNGSTAAWSVFIPEENGANDIVLQANPNFSDDLFYTVHFWEVNNHTHPADPGVSEFASTTASSVDVIVNGTEEISNIGSGEFETTADLSGLLTKGAFNTVELASDSTGGLIATISVDAYRKIGAA